MKKRLWQPEQGERIYLSFKATGKNFASCHFISMTDGLLSVWFSADRYTLPIESVEIKEVVRVTHENCLCNT